jgi:hypothetical protein
VPLGGGAGTVKSEAASGAAQFGGDPCTAFTYEVYVSAKNGKFKLGAQDRATATALAKIAAGRD